MAKETGLLLHARDKVLKRYDNLKEVAYTFEISGVDFPDLHGWIEEKMDEVYNELGRVNRLLGFQATDRSHKEPLRCSFCNSPEYEVEGLFNGSGVFICDKCVVLAGNLLEPHKFQYF